jgi:hypothetical protein
VANFAATVQTCAAAAAVVLLLLLLVQLQGRIAPSLPPHTHNSVPTLSRLLLLPLLLQVGRQDSAEVSLHSSSSFSIKACLSHQQLHHHTPHTEHQTVGPTLW